MHRQLSTSGVLIPCGPFKVRIRSDLPDVAVGMRALYADFPQLGDGEFVDFEVAVNSPSKLRRYLKPQASFSCDGRVPFKPLPLAQAFPMLEWGLNWVISSHAHDYLVIHAAAVERDGKALLLAADPGSGKSTLCAALVHQGWRLLSDELALVHLDDGRVVPIARPISLKNQSISVVQSLGGDVRMGPVCTGTAKGDIAHMRPPGASVTALGTSATPALVVFPRYETGATLSTTQQGKAHAFVELMRHTFNFPLLTGDGFDAIGRMLDQVEVFQVRYSSFGQVLPEIERLWSAQA